MLDTNVLLHDPQALTRFEDNAVVIPIEVVVRNVAAGSMSKRLGIEEGTALPRSIIEFYYKNDQLGDPLVSEEHITAFGWATPQEIDEVLSLALRESIILSSQLPNTHELSLPRHKAILTALQARDSLGARQATLVQLEETGDDSDGGYLV